MSSYLYYNPYCRTCPAGGNGECRACISDGYMIHPETGEVLGDVTTFYQDCRNTTLTMCGDVASYNGYYCADDCEYHEYAAYNNSDGDYYTMGYAERYLYQCDECGDWYDLDDINNGLCPTCYDEASLIRGYHSGRMSGFEIIGDIFDPETVGFEFEADGPYIDREGAARDVDNTFGRAIASYEEDCSLDAGVEIVSNPHTIPEIENFDFDEFAALLLGRDADELPGTAGYHIHFSRACFGATEDEQNETIARIICAYRNNWETLIDLSCRPDEYGIDSYACMPREGVDVDDIIDRNSCTRYFAVNLCNRKTVEFRLGAGYVNGGFMRAWLFLHIEMIRAARAGQAFTVNPDYSITITARAAA